MKTEVKVLENLKYIVKYPNSYKDGEKYPVIIFLHGAGSRGSDINVLMDNPYFQITDKYEQYPFITIAPQCSENTWFDMFESLEKLVLRVVNANYSDRERIYAAGASMGGYATWQLAMSMPEVFSAIMPICGGGMYWNAGRLVNVAVWAFHGKKDDVVMVEESEKMVNAVNQKGGNAKLTVYPENMHDSWSDTYKNPKVFKWLLGNKNSNVEELNDMYHGSKIFG